MKRRLFDTLIPLVIEKVDELGCRELDRPLDIRGCIPYTLRNVCFPWSCSLLSTVNGGWTLPIA